MKIKSIIIDDEEGARESLASMIHDYCHEVMVVAKAGSLQAGYLAINEHKPDLVFLDIAMPQGNAFDLLDKFESIEFDIIFITAYDHYAIRAIKFSALDYLLKPVDIEELRQAIEKHVKNKTAQGSFDDNIRALLHNMKAGDHPKKIAIPDSEGLLFIVVHDIIRCESDSNYTNIYLVSGKKIMASKTLGEFEELLEGDHFIRIHRSHMVNGHQIIKYIKGEGGFVIMSDGTEVEVSRRKKSELLQRLSGT